MFSMKKSLSLVLCVAMLLSMFSVMGFAAEAVDAKTLFSVSAGDFKNDKITYTVYLNKEVTLSGAVIHAKFNKADLKPVSAGSVKLTDPDGDKYDSVSGVYEAGFVEGTTDCYAVGYVYSGETDYKVGSKNKAFVQFTFQAIGKVRPETTVEFYCYEFSSVNTPANNIANGSKVPVAEHTFHTLCGPTVLEKAESVKGGVEVTWNATVGATGYRVYRKAEGASSYSKLVDIEGLETSYVDETVENGKKYTYTVKPKNEWGMVAEYDKDGVSTRFFNAPAKVTTAIKPNAVNVSWSKVAGADYYRVYRRVINENGTKSGWTTVAKKVTACSYTDESKLETGVKYEYTVRAYGDGGYSATYVYGNINYVETPKVTAKSTTSGVKVSWTAVDGAVKYRIYRKVSGGSYVTVTTVDGSKTSYVDKNATNNKKLYYAVRAYTEDASGSTKGGAVNYLKAPNASVKNTNSGVKLSWSKISGAKKYVVYRKAGSATSWTKIATITTNSYVDKNVKAGTKYTYTVKAYNGSFYSAYDTKGDTIYFLKTPSVSSATSSKTGITVKWGKVSGATGYIVERKTGSGEYERLTEFSGNTKVSYVDKTAKKGKTYTYRVYAYKSSSKSAASNTVSCKDKY